MSTGMTRRRFLRAGAVVVGGGAAAALLSSCTAVEQAREASAGTGDSGGTLTIGSLTDIDPKTIYSQSITSMTIGLLLWDTLIRYDHETLEPQPSVATAWETGADGLSVRLELRDDVYFHSGRQLTSEDVAAAIAVYADPESGSQLQSTAAAISSVDTYDPDVAVLTLSRPVVNLFDLFEFMLLTDRETAADLTTGDQFVGTGPFRFASRTPAAGLELVRNDEYWNAPAKLDGITLRVVRDAGALLTSVRTQQTDLVLDASPQSLRPFGDQSLYSITSLDIDDVAYYVGANVADPALQDKRVRQAISFAVDRQRIVDEVLVGRGYPSSAPWAHTSPAYTDEAADYYDRDLDRSRALLADVGWDGSQTLLLSYGTGLAPARNMAAIVQNNLAEVGIEVVLDPREQASYNPFLRSGEDQLWINPHGFGQTNPATLANGAAPFKPEGNLSNFTSADYAAAAEEFDRISDPTALESLAAYQRYTDILLDEQFRIDLAITSWTNVSPARVSGLTSNMYKYIDAREVTVR